MIYIATTTINKPTKALKLFAANKRNHPKAPAGNKHSYVRLGRGYGQKAPHGNRSSRSSR